MPSRTGAGVFLQDPGTGKNVRAVDAYTNEMLKQSKAEQDARAASNSFLGRLNKGFTSPGAMTGDDERAAIANKAMNEANKMRMWSQKMEKAVLAPVAPAGSISKAKKLATKAKSSSISKGASPRR